MSLPSTIDTAFVQQYQNMIYVLCQQKMSKFAPRVRNESVQGESKAFERLGEAEVEEITTRHPQTPNNEQPHSRRWVTPKNYHTASLIDEMDKLAMLIDPTNEYSQNQASALGRQTDDIIIAAALGTAAAGVTATTSSVAFKDETISINGDANGSATSLGTLAAVGTVADIDLGKILLMMSIYNQADVDPGLTKYWAVSPKSIADMLNLTEVGSADYNTVKALAAGTMDSFAGFQFFFSNRLTKDAATSTAYRSISWAQDGILFASAQGVTSRMSERDDLSYSAQVYSKMNGGAVRMDGDKVHECLNKVA
jgi:hypothetical protein